MRGSHTGERPFVCDFTNDCKKAFYTKSTLQSHIRTVHGTSMSCPTCGVIVKSESYRVHKKLHEVSKSIQILKES